MDNSEVFQMVYRKEKHTIYLNTDQLKPGHYFVKVTSQNKVIRTIKFTL